MGVVRSSAYLLCSCGQSRTVQWMYWAVLLSTNTNCLSRLSSAAAVSHEYCCVAGVVAAVDSLSCVVVLYNNM